MKTLLLLRHAKSSWSNDSLADFDRPLNDRGQRDAPRMGRLLAQLDVIPDLIISSAANRAAATAERVAQAAGYEGEIRRTEELYLADPDDYLAVAQSVEDKITSLMLVGHNPGLEELVGLLSGHDEHLPTAALAAFRVDVNRWRDLAAGSNCQLIGVWRPKEL
jgi:phosphohistidine phosphatase